MARSTRGGRRGAVQAVEPEAVENETTDTSAPAEPESQSEDTAMSDTVTDDQSTDAEIGEAAESSEAAVEPEVKAEAQGSGEADASAEPAAPSEASAVDPVEEMKQYIVEVLEKGDPQTGTIPTAGVAGFGEKYRALDAKGKKDVRTYLSDGIAEALEDKSADMFQTMMKAKAYNELLNDTKKSAPAKAAAPKVDPTEDYVNRYVSISLAVMALPVAEGVDQAKAGESIQTLVNAYSTPGTGENSKFNEYLTWYRAENKDERGDEPEVPDYVKTAVKVAEGKAAGRGKRTASGTRASSAGGGTRAAGRDLGKHMTEFFADKEPGVFYSIADICKFQSSEYGSDKPSAGAVNARLFGPKGCTVPGITGVAKDDSPSGKNGAMKIAA